MLKPFAGYALAGLVGLAAPVVALWLARTASADVNPAWGALAVAAGLGLASALVTVLTPARWMSVAAIASAPLCLLGLVMFAALAEAGGRYYWVWIGVAAGGVAAAFAGALLAARKLRA